MLVAAGSSSALSRKPSTPFAMALDCVVRLAAIAVLRRSRAVIGFTLMAECDYKDCRVPPERHGVCAAREISRCWDGGDLHLHHQHTPKRSQGGKKCHVMLCAGHHDNIDNGTRYEGLRLSNRISHWDGDSGPHDYYLIEDRDTDEALLKLEVNV